MLVNSVGHVIYDVHFDSSDHSLVHLKTFALAVEMFEYEGHVYSCFAKE
jgi:hypothetical protein